jgi:hypothetical protein
VAIATQKQGNFHGLYLLSAAVHQKAQKLRRGKQANNAHA